MGPGARAVDAAGVHHTSNRLVFPRSHTFILTNLTSPPPPPPCNHQTKKFEGAGLSRPQAEQLAEHITTQVVLDRLRLSEKFVAKPDLEKVRAALGGVGWRWLGRSGSVDVA